MGIVRAIEEEYWSLQYKTEVLGHHEPIFWPLDGEGKYETEADAIAAMTAVERFNSYKEMRTMKINRRIRYGNPIAMGGAQE